MGICMSLSDFTVTKALPFCCNPRRGKNTGSPEDLGSMEGSCYIHDAEQIIGVEHARIARNSKNMWK